MPSPEQTDRNINRVPEDKLEKEIANAFPTYSLKQLFLINTAEEKRLVDLILGYKI